jgi:hypothetical protein
LIPNNDTYVFFENDKPLKVTRANYYLEVKKINLETFPIIEDFKIDLYDTQSSLGYQLRFTSDSLGIVTTFPWWDHVDQSLLELPDFIPVGTSEKPYEAADEGLLELPDFIPVGTSEKPYEAADEGWCVWIWQEGEYIHILEGDDPLTMKFSVWFKVDSKLFLNEWNRIKMLEKREK